MATFGWSYKSNVCGSKRPKEQERTLEDWQKDRGDSQLPLHSQTHSAESINAGMKRRRFNPRAKIYIGNLSKDTKPVTLAEYFSFFGEIAYMKLMKDRETGISRGFAFITYVDVEAADKATRWCKHNHPRLDDREIKVGLAERRRQQDMCHKQSVDLRGDKKPERRDTHTLYWEYKWSEDPNVEVYGPYETSLMHQWYMADYFSAGCWVRQASVSHREPNRTEDNTKELTSNENIAKPTSLVSSYSSSSEDEESESPVETKRVKLDCNSENGDKPEDNGERVEPLVENSSENEKENELDTNINYEGDGKNTNGGATKEYAIDAKAENETLGSREVPESDYCQGTDDDYDKYVHDPTGSWYQADRGGLRARDLLGRDSSSEDEDYDFYDLYSQTEATENEFVHISEIDFSMFP